MLRQNSSFLQDFKPPSNKVGGSLDANLNCMLQRLSGTSSQTKPKGSGGGSGQAASKQGSLFQAYSTGVTRQRQLSSGQHAGQAQSYQLLRGRKEEVKSSFESINQKAATLDEVDFHLTESPHHNLQGAYDYDQQAAAAPDNHGQLSDFSNTIKSLIVPSHPYGRCQAPVKPIRHHHAGQVSTEIHTSNAGGESLCRMKSPVSPLDLLQTDSREKVMSSGGGMLQNNPELEQEGRNEFGVRQSAFDPTGELLFSNFQEDLAQMDEESLLIKDSDQKLSCHGGTRQSIQDSRDIAPPDRTSANTLEKGGYLDQAISRTTLGANEIRSRGGDDSGSKQLCHRQSLGESQKSQSSHFQQLLRPTGHEVDEDSKSTPQDVKQLSSIMIGDGLGNSDSSGLSLQGKRMQSMIQEIPSVTMTPSQFAVEESSDMKPDDNLQTQNLLQNCAQPAPFAVEFNSRPSQPVPVLTSQPVSFGKDLKQQPSQNSSMSQSAAKRPPSPSFESSATTRNKPPPAPVFNAGQMRQILTRRSGVGSSVKKNKDSNMVQFPWKPLQKVSEKSIFTQGSSMGSTKELEKQFLEKLAKQFQKKPTQRLAKPAPQQISTSKERKLDGCVDYQRSIIIQTSILRNKIDRALFEKIDKGKLKELNVDILQVFLQLYPREKEIELLRQKLEQLGLYSIEEALNDKSLKCGPPEHFVLQVLSFASQAESDLKQKAEIMSRIIEIGPSINQLLHKIQSWSYVKEQIMDNQLLQEIVQITLKFGRGLNSGSSVKGFDLAALPKLFEMKATTGKQKNAYHYIMKFFMAKSLKGEWQKLPLKIFADEVLHEIKKLERPNHLVAQLATIQESKDALVILAEEWKPVDQGFKTMLQEFTEFYEKNVKPELLFFTQEFKDTVANLSEFLEQQVSDTLTDCLSTLVDFSVKHSKHVEAYKKQKKAKMVSQRQTPTKGQPTMVPNNSQKSLKGRASPRNMPATVKPVQQKVAGSRIAQPSRIQNESQKLPIAKPPKQSITPRHNPQLVALTDAQPQVPRTSPSPVNTQPSNPYATINSLKRACSPPTNVQSSKALTFDYLEKLNKRLTSHKKCSNQVVEDVKVFSNRSSILSSQKRPKASVSADHQLQSSAYQSTFSGWLSSAKNQKTRRSDDQTIVQDRDGSRKVGLDITCRLENNCNVQRPSAYHHYTPAPTSAKNATSKAHRFSKGSSKKNGLGSEKSNKSASPIDRKSSPNTAAKTKKVKKSNITFATSALSGRQMRKI